MGEGNYHGCSFANGNGAKEWRGAFVTSWPAVMVMIILSISVFEAYRWLRIPTLQSSPTAKSTAVEARENSRSKTKATNQTKPVIIRDVQVVVKGVQTFDTGWGTLSQIIEADGMTEEQGRFRITLQNLPLNASSKKVTIWRVGDQAVMKVDENEIPMEISAAK